MLKSRASSTAAPAIQADRACRHPRAEPQRRKARSDCYAKRALGGAKGQRQPSEVVVQPGHEPGRASSGDRAVGPA